MKALRVPKPAAQAAKDRLLELGLFDEERRIARDDGVVEVPVTGEPPGELVERLDGEVVEGGGRPRTFFRDPHRAIRRRLAGRVPGEVVDALPSGYAVLGDVALLDLPEPAEPYAAAIGAAYGETLPVRTVLDRDRIAGELREPDARRIWGEQDTETVHREHGIAYVLDPAEVMFSPGNKAERRRVRDADLAGTRVVDLFAGVGQFAVPAAVAGAEVVACEKNPTAATYLEGNAERNGVADRLEVRQGDCRDVAPTGTADLVVMGLLPDAWPFLDVAERALAGRGRAWLHDVTGTGEEIEAPEGARLRDAWTVKPYGPCRDHVVLELEVPA